MSCSMLNCWILASMQLNKSAMGNQRYTCMYLHIHPVSVLWNPSYTAMPNASGPSIDSTMRKNVLSTSIISDTASNTSSRI